MSSVLLFWRSPCIPAVNSAQNHQNAIQSQTSSYILPFFVMLVKKNIHTFTYTTQTWHFCSRLDGYKHGYKMSTVCEENQQIAL